MRICLNVVFGVKRDEFYVLTKYIFEFIAKAMDEKITKVSAEKSLF